SAARREAPPPERAADSAVGGTIREGYAPPPSSQPMSSVRPSRPAARWFTRIMVVLALGCIVGGGLYLVPLLFPDASGSGSGKKPKPTTTPKPTTSPSISTSTSVSTSASAIDH